METIESENITVDTYQDIDVKELALDHERFGTLIFSNAVEPLEKIKKLHISLENLNYKDKLTPQEVADIDTHKKHLVDNLVKINDFDIKQPDAGSRHDQLEAEIINYVAGAEKTLRDPLVYLRQELALSDTDQKLLQEERSQAEAAKKEYTELSEQLKNELATLAEQKKMIESGKGEVASKQLAYHFAKQRNDDRDDARGWLKIRNVFFWTFVILVAANVVIYIAMEAPETFFTIQYGVLKLALFALLSYGLGFATRNYNIISNLEATNCHRKNVAQTLEDYLAANPDDQETKSQMIKQGTAAMFKHFPTGYIGKGDHGDKGPIHEVVTQVVGPPKEG